MGKLLFWIVIIIGVLFVARIAGRMAAARQDSPAAAKPRAKASPPATGAPEAMVRCAHCGIHLPRSEALLLGGQTWCSQEHARLGPAAK
ncbi:PP0621 family protein [Achromobacter sp.]|uniref:PP0621 family protein n=1 Tax=Achromobacter sp. TaxID=134375 RepID=UPI003D08CBDB